MKFTDYEAEDVTGMSHPARGGWIEIGKTRCKEIRTRVPPRTGWVD